MAGHNGGGNHNVNPKDQLAHSELIGGWTKARLHEFINGALRSNPATLPRGITMEKVRASELLDVMNELKLSDRAAAYICARLHEIGCLGDQVIDSTEDVGDEWGVHSTNPDTGNYVADDFLMSDGSGGSRWRPGKAGFPHGGSIEEAFNTPSGLTAWWRLGENTTWPTYGHTTVGWGADSGPYGRSLDAYHTGPANITGHTPDVHQDGWYAPTPADDGAIIFRAFGEATSQEYEVGLKAQNGTAPSSALGETITGWSLSAMVLCPSSYYTITGGPGEATLIGDYYRSFGGGVGAGLRLSLNPSTRQLAYHTADLANGYTFSYTLPVTLVADEWYHFVVTLEKVDATHWRRRIILDLVELYDQTDVRSVIAPSVSGGAPYMGTTVVETAVSVGASAGGLDEVATWNHVLTDTEILAINNTVVEAAGDVFFTDTINGSDIADGSITADKMASRDTLVAPNAAQYAVPTADGSGGVAYALSTINVTVNGS